MVTMDRQYEELENMLPKGEIRRSREISSPTIKRRSKRLQSRYPHKPFTESLGTPIHNRGSIDDATLDRSEDQSTDESVSATESSEEESSIEESDSDDSSRYASTQVSEWERIRRENNDRRALRLARRRGQQLSTTPPATQSAPANFIASKIQDSSRIVKKRKLNNSTSTSGAEQNNNAIPSLDDFTTFLQTYKNLQDENQNLQAQAAQNGTYQASLAQALQREERSKRDANKKNQQLIEARNAARSAETSLNAARLQVATLEQEILAWSAEVDLLRTEKAELRDVTAGRETESEALLEQLKAKIEKLVAEVHMGVAKFEEYKKRVRAVVNEA